MSQGFLIVTDSTDTNRYAAKASHRDQITGMLQGKGWHVWHWFDDVWIVKTNEDTTSAGAIRDEINEKVDKTLSVLV